MQTLDDRIKELYINGRRKLKTFGLPDNEFDLDESIHCLFDETTVVVSLDTLENDSLRMDYVREESKSIYCNSLRNVEMPFGNSRIEINGYLPIGVINGCVCADSCRLTVLTELDKNSEAEYSYTMKMEMRPGRFGSIVMSTRWAGEPILVKYRGKEYRSTSQVYMIVKDDTVIELCADDIAGDTAISECPYAKLQIKDVGYEEKAKQLRELLGKPYKTHFGLGWILLTDGKGDLHISSSKSLRQLLKGERR